ncbi:MAG: E3 binding domain-containing protein [Clostridiales bacterium]|nr:E3 binding domain-containing protein [Clostridiales bacterium]
MVTEVVMPKLGLTMTEGLVVGLLKNEGDAVKKGEGVFEIETEKLTNTVEAPVDGVLVRVEAKVGEVYPIAAVLGYVGDEGGALRRVRRGATERLATASQSSASASLSETPCSASCLRHSTQSSDYDTQGADGISSTGRVKASPAARALARKYGVDYAGLKGSGPGGRIVREDVEREAARSESQDTDCRIEPLQQGLYTGARRTLWTHR